MELTQKYLKTVLTYEEESGLLIWLKRNDRSPQWNGRYGGMYAGCVTYFERGGPYVVLSIYGQPRLAHRIIWLYHYGYMPEYIDHKDGNGMNNRLGNLREATQSLNNANSNLSVRGVEKRGNSYRARIKINGKTLTLGSFDTEQEAHAAFRMAHDKHYDEYSRYNRIM